MPRAQAFTSDWLASQQLSSANYGASRSRAPMSEDGCRSFDIALTSIWRNTEIVAPTESRGEARASSRASSRLCSHTCSALNLPLRARLNAAFAARVPVSPTIPAMVSKIGPGPCRRGPLRRAVNSCGHSLSLPMLTSAVGRSPRSGRSGRTRVARGPFAPDLESKSTRWPFISSRWPVPSMEEKCTNT